MRLDFDVLVYFEILIFSLDTYLKGLKMKWWVEFMFIPNIFKFDIIPGQYHGSSSHLDTTLLSMIKSKT